MAQLSISTPNTNLINRLKLPKFANVIIPDITKGAWLLPVKQRV